MPIVKQIELELRKGDHEVLTPWEIQDFIGTLASNYYKLDLINEISKKINTGINQEDIFIMNESFNYKTTYRFLKESKILNLNNSRDFKNFYHFGNPISLIPNEDIKHLNLKFELFRDINTYLGKRTGKKISKDDFHKVIFQKNDEFNEILNLIKFDKDISRDEREKIMHEVQIERNKVVEKLEKFKRASFEIDCLKKYISDNDTEKIKEKIEIEETYFKSFEKTFMKLDKPVVGIYNKEKKQVEILSPSFIIKESRTERFLDIKEISHNSPTYVKVRIGTIFANTLVRMANNISSKVKGRVSETIYDEKIAKEIKKIDELLNQKELINEMKQVAKEEKLNCNEEIKNDYIKNIFESLKENTEDKVLDSMKEYKFENDNLKAKVIDFNDYRNRGNKGLSSRTPDRYKQ